MENKTYHIQYLPIFKEDLSGIVDYITQVLHNPRAAERLVNDVEVAIYHRLKAPLGYAPYPTNTKRPHPYYRIQVRNYSIFYVVKDKTMEVRRIIYNKRDIKNLL